MGTCLSMEMAVGVYLLTPEPVPCATPAARSSVLKLVPDDPARCPADTDGTLDDPTAAQPSRVACVRNRTAPHPGDPGKGGGVLRVGDCTLSLFYFPHTIDVRIARFSE